MPTVVRALLKCDDMGEINRLLKFVGIMYGIYT